MEDIFSSKDRINILRNIIYTNNPISVNLVAKNLKISKGLVSKYFVVLSKHGVTKKHNGKYIIINSYITKAIKILLNIMDIDIKIFKKFNFVESVGLYGSCAKGENSEDSDVDIWIKIKDVNDEKLATVTSLLNKKIKDIKPLFLTDNKIKKIKKDDEIFYHSLSFGSIIIYGDNNGI